jgi:hypothetical protein
MLTDIERELAQAEEEVSPRQRVRERLVSVAVLLSAKTVGRPGSPRKWGDVFSPAAKQRWEAEAAKVFAARGSVKVGDTVNVGDRDAQTLLRVYELFFIENGVDPRSPGIPTLGFTTMIAWDGVCSSSDSSDSE